MPLILHLTPLTYPTLLIPRIRNFNNRPPPIPLIIVMPMVRLVSLHPPDQANPMSGLLQSTVWATDMLHPAITSRLATEDTAV